MRTLFLTLLSLGFLLTACNNNKPKGITVTSEDGKEKATIDVSAMTAASDDIQKKLEELKKLPPLTTDQLKAMLPEELLGMKRSSFNANAMMGYSLADANYRKDTGDARLQISIIDCAGEAGAGFYSLTWAGMNMVSENDNGYSKTIEFNGGKAVESYKKNNDEYQLTYVASDRLLVTIEGEKVGLDAVKEVAKGLNTSVK